MTSTSSGRCGPCCSTAASGNTAIQFDLSAAATRSCAVISAQSRLGSVLIAVSPTVLCSPIVPENNKGSNDEFRGLVARPGNRVHRRARRRANAGQGHLRHQLGGGSGAWG